MSNPDENCTESSDPVRETNPEQLRDAKCTDTDILSVSCKLAHHSIDIVAECLGLQEYQVQDALNRVTERHHDYNKVHLLLIKWRDVNGDGATRDALMQCLQSLPEPENADNNQGEFTLLEIRIIFMQLPPPVFEFNVSYNIDSFALLYVNSFITS